MIVFSAEIDAITMIGLNVARTVLYNHKIEKRLLDCRTKCAARAAKILSSVGEEDLEDYASIKEFYADPVRALHDVVAMVCLDCPDIFTFETLPIQICVGNPPLPSGQTIINAEVCNKKDVRVVTKVESEAFYDRMVEALFRLG